MNTYTSKIVITQQPGTDKPGFENEDGELYLLIEYDLSEEVEKIDDYREMIAK